MSINIENESTTSSITLSLFQKIKVKKDKAEEFIYLFLTQEKNYSIKTYHNTIPTSPIIRDYKTQVCYPLFTTKTLHLIKVPIQTIIYTYRCGHKKITKYTTFKQYIIKKNKIIKSSRRRHFYYFKSIQQKHQSYTNQGKDLCTETYTYTYLEWQYSTKRNIFKAYGHQCV